MITAFVLAAALIILAVCEDSPFHNTWSVHLDTTANPDAVALALHLDNLGQIGQLKDYYLFRYPTHPRRSRRHSEDITDYITSHPQIRSAEQQRILSRQKRSVSTFSFNDVLYPKQWYLSNDYNNITGAWSQGVTGHGIVVTILDDGIEWTHPDLQENYEAKASVDLNEHDDDPMPRYDITNENKHGTRCAGEVASVANNKYCGVGAAYKSRIGGVRMLDGDVTDAIEAKAIGHRPGFIDIYSASWGPDDDGRTVDGPGKLTIASFELGIKDGRDGLGNIFVWASGNGGVSYDNCNCDGYTNSIWTLSIGSTSENGKKPWYAEECSSTLAVTYSSGSGKERQIISTDLHSKCTERHTGTSAAAPLAAGIFALVLQANPTLTWRDLQHLVVRSSKERNLEDPQWVTNGAGFKVSHKFGYGVIDAGALVELAQLWNNVPSQTICETDVDNAKKSIGSEKDITLTIDTDGCGGTVNYLEHVQAVVTITADKRGDIELYLVSPGGKPGPFTILDENGDVIAVEIRGEQPTDKPSGSPGDAGVKSTLLTPRKFDGSGKGFAGWPFLTVHNWGEDPAGTWKLLVRNNGDRKMVLVSWQLRLHGTATFPSLRNSSREIPPPGNRSDSECDTQCESGFGCHGPGPGNCSVCKHYLQQSSNLCIEICGLGEYLDRKGRVCVKHCDDGEYVTSEGQCDKCDERCLSCGGGSDFNCTSCDTGLFLDPTRHTCVENCPTYMLTRDVECVSCNPDCLTCTDVGYDKCLTCQTSLFFYNNRCLQTCPKNMYANRSTDTCMSCAAGCSSCIGPGSNQCLTCDEGLYFANAQCVATCPNSYYALEDSNECHMCHYTCDTCDAPTSHDCTLCTKGLYKYNELCLKPCPDGFVANSTTRTCDTCHVQCQTCYGPTEEQCTQCTSEYKLVESVCVSVCEAGKYNADGECKPCDPNNCTTCSGPGICTGCSPDLILHEGQCLSLCPEGSYKSGTGCVPCDSKGGCKDCASDAVCTACNLGYTMSTGKCINPCRTGQYLNQGVCDVCVDECSECDGGRNINCKRCKNSDINTKIDRYGITGHVFCGGCLTGCELCSQPYNNYCLSCQTGEHILYDQKVEGRATCVDQCISGTFQTEVNGLSQCQPCHNTCKECVTASEQSCSACTSGYVLEQGACQTQCSDSFYRNDTVCKPCSNTCKTCVGGGADQCLSCPPGQVHFQQSCVSGCTSAFYKDGDSCLPCHATCTQCSGGSGHQCSECIDGFIMSEDRCVSTCTQGTYNDQELNFCRPCHVSCTNCTGEGRDKCLSCKGPLVKNPSSSECWPCCSELITEHCCYCSGAPTSLLCTQHVVIEHPDIEYDQVKTIAVVIFGTVVLFAVFTLFGYILYRWKKSHAPVNYMLVPEEDRTRLIGATLDEDIVSGVQM